MMFFLSGIVYSLMIPFVYLVSMRIFNNKKIALVSSLFISLNTDVIFSGMYSLPRSAVSFLEVMLILLLLGRNDPKKLLLALILTFIIIVYHTASIPFIMLLLLIIYTFQKYYGVRVPILFTLNYLILTIAMSLGYWIFHAEHFTAFGEVLARFIGAYSHILFAILIYFTLLEAYKGQTPGKYLLGIRVVKAGGLRIGLVESGIRNMGKVFLLPFDLLVGIIFYRKRGYLRFFDYYADVMVERVKLIKK